MKIIMTDDVSDVSPGVLLFTKERRAEILEFACGRADCPECDGTGDNPASDSHSTDCPAC